jgi:hypothetical protein
MAALTKGRSRDVKPAVEAHRKAIADAVDQALRISRAAGANPSLDPLSQTFDALSLMAEPPPPGRLVEPLRPGGFEMLTGVTIPHAPRRGSAAGESRPASPTRDAPHPSPAEQRRHAAAARALERQQQAKARRHAAAQAKAERHLAEVVERERRARLEWEQARVKVESAKRALAALSNGSGR